MRFAFLLLAILFAPTVASADEHGEGIKLYPADKVEWKDGPPSLPKGAKIAVLE